MQVGQQVSGLDALGSNTLSQVTPKVFQQQESYYLGRQTKTNCRWDTVKRPSDYVKN